MNFEIKTLRDLTHQILNMPEVENSFGAVVSPEIVIHTTDKKEFVINDFYLRGDNKVVLILTEK